MWAGGTTSGWIWWVGATTSSAGTRRRRSSSTAYPWGRPRCSWPPGGRCPGRWRPPCPTAPIPPLRRRPAMCWPITTTSCLPAPAFRRGCCSPCCARPPCAGRGLTCGTPPPSGRWRAPAPPPCLSMGWRTTLCPPPWWGSCTRRPGAPRRFCGRPARATPRRWGRTRSCTGRRFPPSSGIISQSRRAREALIKCAVALCGYFAPEFCCNSLK